MNDLSGDPGVEDFAGVLWGLDDDSCDGSFSVVAHKPSGIDAEATVDVLKTEK